MQFFGPDLRSATEEELDAVSAQVNNALMRLGSGWAYFIEAQRRRYNYYPNSTWPTRASSIVDSERARIFLSGDNFLSSYFLTFSYMPPSERTQKLAARFLNEKTVNYMKHLDYFRDEYGKITDTEKSDRERRRCGGLYKEKGYGKDCGIDCGRRRSRKRRVQVQLCPVERSS